MPGVVTLTLLGMDAGRRVEFSTAMARGMIIDVSMNLLIGGFRTTNSALASCVVALQHDRELRHRLIADPTLIDAFIEEIVRAYAPSTGMARTVTTDRKLGETLLRAGEKAYLFIMAANRSCGWRCGPSSN